MQYNKFDDEYYVMSIDGANNHPMIAWGDTDFGGFLKSEPIQDGQLELPLKLLFDEPYPKEYEMADLLMLMSELVGSEKLKTLFEKMNIYGVQFFPAEIKSNKGDIITGHYAMHLWNKLRAIDKNNYEGGEPNRFGTIRQLSRFSLDTDLLASIPLEKRLIFPLEEKKIIVVVHESLYKTIESENLTGMRFWKVSEWNDNAMFR